MLTINQEQTFNVTSSKGQTFECKMFDDDGKIHFYSIGVCLKAHYTEQDNANIERLTNQEKLTLGDVVLVNGIEHFLAGSENNSIGGLIVPCNVKSFTVNLGYAKFVCATMPEAVKKLNGYGFDVISYNF